MFSRDADLLQHRVSFWVNQHLQFHVFTHEQTWVKECKELPQNINQLQKEEKKEQIIPFKSFTLV